MYGPLFLHFVGSDEQRAFVSNEEAMRTEIAASLARLGVDYIDCYLLHCDDQEHPIGELVSFMDSMCVSDQVSSDHGESPTCNWNVS